MSVYIERNQEEDAYNDIIDKVNAIIRASDFLNRRAMKEKALAEKEARITERNRLQAERMTKAEERKRLAAEKKAQLASSRKTPDRTYTMGTLIFNLQQEYNFAVPLWGDDKVYRYLCQKAMEIVEFTKNELYQDKYAVLRLTQLGEERYAFLYRELKKFGKPKEM